MFTLRFLIRRWQRARTVGDWIIFFGIVACLITFLATIYTAAYTALR